MSLAKKYEEFGRELSDSGKVPDRTDGNVEIEKLQSFDEGYEAGWEDSIQAQKQAQKEISTNFAENLQEISFSYHEARSKLTQALHPLFDDILSAFLPEIVNTTIAPHISAQLCSLVQNQSDQKIEVTVSTKDFDLVNEALGELISKPFVLIADPELGSGLVYLKVGAEEREVNFDKMIQDVRNSTNSLFEQEPIDE